MNGHECNGGWSGWYCVVKKWIGILEYIWVCSRCGKEYGEGY